MERSVDFPKLPLDMDLVPPQVVALKPNCLASAQPRVGDSDDQYEVTSAPG